MTTTTPNIAPVPDAPITSATWHRTYASPEATVETTCPHCGRVHRHRVSRTEPIGHRVPGCPPLDLDGRPVRPHDGYWLTDPANLLNGAPR